MMATGIVAQDRVSETNHRQLAGHRWQLGRDIGGLGQSGFGFAQPAVARIGHDVPVVPVGPLLATHVSAVGHGFPLAASVQYDVPSPLVST